MLGYEKVNFDNEVYFYKNHKGTVVKHHSLVSSKTEENIQYQISFVR